MQGACQVIPFKAIREGGSVYIAGPMSGHDDLNWPAFRAVEIELHCNGIYTLVPHRIVRIISVTTADLLPIGHPDRDAANDLTCFAWSISQMIGAAKQVVLLPNYGDSEGTRAEIAVALRLGIPVFEVVYEDGAPVGVVAFEGRVGVL